MALVSREETLAFFGGLFTGTEADPSSPFWSFLASAAERLWPKEILPTLEQAYDHQLIDPFFIDLKLVEGTLSLPLQEHLAEVRETLGEDVPRDVHGYISWFACFEPKERPVSWRQGNLTREEKERKKAKKKQAKRSKKKNRR